MNGKYVHELHFMHVIKTSEVFVFLKFTIKFIAMHVFLNFLCREHKEKGEEHLVPGLKKKQFSLLHLLEEARQESKRCVKCYTYTWSLTSKVCS
jgi:hypothetical protein